MKSSYSIYNKLFLETMVIICLYKCIVIDNAVDFSIRLNDISNVFTSQSLSVGHMRSQSVSSLKVNDIQKGRYETDDNV